MSKIQEAEADLNANGVDARAGEFTGNTHPTTEERAATLRALAERAETIHDAEASEAAEAQRQREEAQRTLADAHQCQHNGENVKRLRAEATACERTLAGNGTGFEEEEAEPAGEEEDTEPVGEDLNGDLQAEESNDDDVFQPERSSFINDEADKLSDTDGEEEATIQEFFSNFDRVRC